MIRWVRDGATAAALKRVRFTRRAATSYAVHSHNEVVRLSLRKVAAVDGCHPGAASRVRDGAPCLVDGVHLAPRLYSAAALAILAALGRLEDGARSACA